MASYTHLFCVPSSARLMPTPILSHLYKGQIVLATSVNPKIVGGRLFLNATSATHLYFDSETSAGKEVFEKLPRHGADQPTPSSKVVHAQKIEPLTVSELNQFIITAETHIIEFFALLR
ncbi:hypothetical protein Rs2_09671 [Raphanus sativus]|nr:hypothetical protein Rs2_09671 [Raphanus sativus]